MLMHIRAIMFSGMAEVIVGEKKKTFVVHKDLLVMHSTIFSDSFIAQGPDVDRVPLLQTEPRFFAQFVSWIYVGELLSHQKGISVAELWELGRYLGAPTFQNFCMDFAREHCKNSDRDATEAWPSPSWIMYAYSKTERHSLIRTLAVDVLSYENPLQKNEASSPAWKEWESLLTGKTSSASWAIDLQKDFALKASRNWNGIPPVSAGTPLEESSVTDCQTYSGTIAIEHAI